MMSHCKVSITSGFIIHIVCILMKKEIVAIGIDSVMY